jgi:hypothetical protein
MSKRRYTNLDLLKSAKLRAMIPEDQLALSDEDILILASEKLKSELLPNIMSAREEYYVHVEEQPISSDNSYEIPYRAAGSKLRTVFLKDGSGYLYKCSEVSVDEVPYLTSYYGEKYNTPLFYMQNTKIVFVGDTLDGVAPSSVQMHYYLQPNELVLPERCLTISSIDRDTGRIEVDERQIPNHFQSEAEVDLIQYNGSNKLLALDKALVSVSSNTPVTSQKFVIMDPNDIPDSLQVGDYIALAQESPVPQLPNDLRPALVQNTICCVLEAQGDLDNLRVARETLAMINKKMFNLIQDRSEGTPKKVVNRNGTIRNSLIGTALLRRR